jgi:predicted PurR-regulated permease PerM
MESSRYRYIRKLRRPVCLVLTILVALGLVVLLILVILPQFAETFTGLAEKLPEYLNDTFDWVEETLRSFNIMAQGLTDITIDWEKALESLTEYLTNSAESLIATATTVTSSVVRTTVSMVFSLVIAVYVLAQKERVGHFVRRVLTALLPEKASAWVFRVSAMSDDIFSSFITGQFLESCILGFLCYIGMLIFRFPYAGTISVVIGVTSLVPIVGSFVGEVVGVFLILFVDPIKALLFLVYILCLQQIEGNLIYPRVVGKSVGVPGVLVLCSVIVGGRVSGVMGALFGVPVCAVLYTLLRELVDTRIAGKTISGEKSATVTKESAPSRPAEEEVGG